MRLPGIFLKLVLIFILPTFPGMADTLDQKKLDGYEKSLKIMEKELQKQNHGRDELDDWQTKLTRAQTFANLCVSDLQQHIDDLNDDLTKLGEKTSAEPANVSRKRKELENDRIKLTKPQAACRLIELRSKTMLTQISTINKQILKQEMLARSPDILEIITENLTQPMFWVEHVQTFIDHQGDIKQISSTQVLIVATVLAILIFLGVKLRAILRYWGAAADLWNDSFASRFTLALVTTLEYYTLPLLITLGLSALAFLYTHNIEPTPFASITAYSLLVYVLAILIVRLLFMPPKPARQFLSIVSRISTGLSRRLRVLALIVLIGYLAIASLHGKSIPESSYMLAYSIWSFMMAANLIWALRLVSGSEKISRRLHILITSVMVIIAVSLLVEWIGYRNLALQSRRVVIGTFITYGAALITSLFLRDLFNSIDKGKSKWTHKIRALTGSAPQNRVTGLVWVRMVTTISIWSLFAYTVLIIWGVSSTISAQIHSYIVQGFNIGSLRIVPVMIFWATISFAVLYTIGGWFRSELEQRWLTLTTMDRGAREALVTVSGYIVVTVALIISLGIAGLDFSKIAIIAGALSVGIGFGLQNIVNNFISGLILLFERPIKTGDWIVVGATEGYVRKIRIRTTQIQTFDRSDVIVPNSELISNQVTNWMLSSIRGRLKASVGVAYGSNTELVKQLLEQVAEENTNVIKDGSSPKPLVLFLGFGDSSLDFELRVHVYNVDERIRIKSDINFAIDKAFRDNRIEIPFPQRDIHVRDLPTAPSNQTGDA